MTIPYPGGYLKPMEIEQKIARYDSIISFYERNRGKRFQTKSNLKVIANEINSELGKVHKKKCFDKLSSLKYRIFEFI